ncbi:VIT domain-containing protein [Roseateles sp. BYS78W]|uniref:VIT domain-containing protein n=1 Tax=Pelomonas candidula TaxID=3299025 RepID=A0ABW7H6B5_9BURK
MPSATMLRSLLALLSLAAAATVALGQAAPPVKPTPAPVIIQPRFVVPDASQPLSLQRVDVQTVLAGSQAQTRIELVVHNPNARVLEATLEFPLADGQGVAGFALDINGELVSAVPVPKDKGRQVFDDVTRQRVDPALLERTAGNSFKLRIYPLPAGGERRVLLQLTETLHADAKGLWHWRLPLDFGQPIVRFDGRIALRGATGKPQALGALDGAEHFANADEAGLQIQRQNWRPHGALVVGWKAGAADSSVVQAFAGSAYGYAELTVDTARGAPKPPRELNLVWDASGSGAQRDHAREFALLDALFAAARDVRVQLTVARDAAEPAATFDVKAGDWSVLRKRLETVPYDGATSAAAWGAGFGPARDGALTLLFSDGLANWPDITAAPTGPLAPVFALTAAARIDSARLRRLAETQGGRLVDLNRLDTPAALDALIRPALRLADVRADGAEQVVTASQQPEDGRLLIAARLTAPTATLQLTLVDAQGRRVPRTLTFTAPPAAKNPADEDAAVPLAARRWAELRSAELEADRPRHRAEIRRLGEQFRLVGPETSLIVLDNLADYIRYEIVPPTAAMRAAYQQRVGQRDAERGQARERQLDSLVRRFAERQAWWEREFPKDAPPPPVAAVPPPLAMVRPTTAAMAAGIVAEDVGRFPDARVAESMQRIPGVPAPVAAPAPPPAGNQLESVVVAGMRSAAPAKPAPAEASSATIALRRWEPDAAYARRLREAGDADRYAIYLDERIGYTSSTAFFIDAAEIFFTKGQQALALRVLSNLAEMELENRHILRILAYRLTQAGELKLAIPLLERVRELAPDEPQSHRDLALALAQAGQPQRAVDLLWDVAARPWDGRFAEIDLIALTELNAIAARTPGVDLGRVDARLRRNLPLDLRAVLAWDADNTDIDLWVTDPNGEKAFYGHRLTRQGGAMSRDFTGGYGPEEFSLRKAKPGRYEVRAQFYGHRQQLVSPYTTLMLWLATGYGTPGQKDERVVLRLSGRGDQVLVGTFDVAAPAGGDAK